MKRVNRLLPPQETVRDSVRRGHRSGEVEGGNQPSSIEVAVHRTPSTAVGRQKFATHWHKRTRTHVHGSAAAKSHRYESGNARFVTILNPA